MLWSYKLEEESFLMFSLFINSILQGKKEYTPKVDAVVEEAKALAVGRANVYEIDKDNFPITVFLSKNAKDFLLKVNPKSLSITDYQYLLQILEKQDCVHC